METKTTVNKPKLVVYLKPTCGWSQGVRAVLHKYDLPYEEHDVLNDRHAYQTMVEKSGQTLSPCVEVNGQMLSDISGAELEEWLLRNQLVMPSNRKAEAPLNSPCASEMATPAWLRS